MATATKKETLTKKDIIRKISAQNSVHPQDVRLIIQAFLEEMIVSLSKGKRLEFRDFGVFEVVTRQEKIGRNPRKAAQAIIIPKRNVVKFTQGKKMRSMITSVLP